MTQTASFAARPAYAPVLLRLGCAALVLFAAVKLWDEAGNLFIPAHRGAQDVRYYWTWTQQWFAGSNVYVLGDRAEYPPASMMLLWPLFGWAPWPAALWISFVTTAAAMAWLIQLAVRESGATSSAARACAALMLPGMNAAGITIGNGQLGLVTLACALAGALLLRRAPGWRTDLAAACLLTISLVKPSVSAPFALMAVMAAPRVRWRPWLLVSAAYATLTLAAASFQAERVDTLILTSMSNGAALATSVFDGNVHYVLGRMHVPFLALPASAAGLVLLAWWITRVRCADWWILAGVTAIFTRFWVYHRTYDNVLLLVPEIALFRIASGGDDSARTRRTARWLLVATVISGLPPWNLHYIPHERLWIAVQTGIWTADLVFLLRCAAQSTATRAAKDQAP